MSGILEIKRGITDVISLEDGEFYLHKGKNYVQIGSGSSILTLLPLNQSVAGDIILDGNIYANNLTGSGQLGYQIQASISVGGISDGDIFPIGTSYDDIFYDLLTPYQDSILSNLVLKNGVTLIALGNAEVGSSFEFTKIEFLCTADEPDNAYPINASFEMIGSTSSDFTYNIPTTISSTNNITIGYKNPSRATVGDITFILRAKRPDNSQFITPISASISFNFKNYIAASSTLITNTSTAQSVITSNVVDYTLDSNNSWTATCGTQNNDTTKWTYIIYPHSYSDLSYVLQNNAFDVLRGSFEKLTNSSTGNDTFPITNTNGITTNYKIYKSTQLGAYSSGSTLTMI